MRHHGNQTQTPPAEIRRSKIDGIETNPMDLNLEEVPMKNSNEIARLEKKVESNRRIIEECRALAANPNAKRSVWSGVASSPRPTPKKQKCIFKGM